MITMSIEANWERGISGTRICNGERSFAFDRNAALGEVPGSDSVQSLLTTLAGCLIGMGKLVAKEHNLCIDGIVCRVEGDIDPDPPTARGSAARAGCREIRMTMTVQSSEDEDRLNAWLAEVERRCPIRNGSASAMTATVFMKN